MQDQMTKEAPVTVAGFEWKDSSWWQESEQRKVVEWEAGDGKFFLRMEVQQFQAPEGHLAWTLNGYHGITWAGMPDVEEFYHEAEFATMEEAMTAAAAWDREMWDRLG